MRILLDENLDWGLGGDLPGHRIESVPLIGWAGIANGEGKPWGQASVFAQAREQSS